MSDLPDSPSAAVVIGASVGAIEALTQILPTLPADFPHPVLVVVHVPPDKDSRLPELFAERTQLDVKESEDKEPILPGTIYFAPADYHLLVEPDFHISLSSDEPVHYSRPAVDVLFESASDAWGDSLTGIILTGASADGAHGLKVIEEAGGTTLVQDPQTAEGAIMPQAALDACKRAKAMTLKEIASTLTSNL